MPDEHFDKSSRALCLSGSGQTVIEHQGAGCGRDTAVTETDTGPRA